MPRKGPLSGVRVIAITQAHAGPFATQVLGDLGAEVIKIEPPGIGENARSTAPKLGGLSYYTLALNRNTKFIALDLRTETGKQAFNDLIKISDVFISNLRYGAQQRTGAGYETLRQINPRIIHCSITGYGPSGPYRDYPCMDDMAQGITGMYSLCGEPGKAPMRSSAAVADISAALFAAVGILAALHERNSKGVGRKVEINLLDVCMSLLSANYQAYFITGRVPEPQGSRHSTFAMTGAFRTKNGYLTLGPCWPRIAKVINREEIMHDPRFSTVEGRFKHKEELNNLIEENLMRVDKEDWLELMREEDISGAPVNNFEEVLRDPQIVHNKPVIKMNHPVAGEIKAIDCPIKMEGAISGEHSPPGFLGEHTEQVLKELLGYSEEKIEKLKQEEAKASRELVAHVRHGEP